MLLVAQKIPSGKVWSRRISNIDQNESLQNVKTSLHQWIFCRELSNDVRFTQNDLWTWKILSSEVTTKHVKMEKKRATWNTHRVPHGRYTESTDSMWQHHIVPHGQDRWCGNSIGGHMEVMWTGFDRWSNQTFPCGILVGIYWNVH